MSDATAVDPNVDDDLQQPQGETCAACGAPVDALDKFCNACGTGLPETAEPADVVEAELVEEHLRHFRCKNCGSEVSTDPQQRSYTCAFCDSTYVVEFSPKVTGRQRPEFVIGFSVTREQAQKKFQTWLSSNPWFRPGDLVKAKIEEKLRGIYLPFWSFSMLADSEWSASIGEYWYRTETYTTMQNGKMVTKTRTVTETEWWDLAGRHHEYYSGFLISGSRGLPQTEASRIMPFHLPALQRYRPYFLAGWLGEEYSVEREQALEMCKGEFYRREQANIARFMPGDKHRNLRVKTWFSNANSDLILLPVYLLSYRYDDKLYRFMINGQTGKIDGDKPVSRKRITIAVLSGLAVVILVILLIMLISALGQ